MGKSLKQVSEHSLQRLREYSWPGNVRELANIIERGAIIANQPIVEIDEVSRATTWNILENHGASGTLANVERSHMLRVLDDCSWILEGPQGAAHVLGLNPSTLRFRMRKLGITRPSVSS